MKGSDIERGKKAAYGIYRQLRQEGISYAVAFQAAVEKCQLMCPGRPPAEIEAAAWEAIRKQIHEELAARSKSRADHGPYAA